MKLTRILLMPLAIAALVPATAGAQTVSPTPEPGVVVKLDEHGDIAGGSGRAGVLDFGDQVVGTASATHSIVLVNDTGATVRAPRFSVHQQRVVGLNHEDTGAFTVIDNRCVQSLILEPGTSCAIRLTFAPHKAGSYFGSVHFGDGRSVQLGGYGGDLDRWPVDFGAQSVSSVSSAQQIPYRNQTGRTIQMRAASLTGADTTSFRIAADECGGRWLARGEECSVSVAFAPGAPGATQDLRAGRKQARLVFGDVAHEAPDEFTALSGTATR